MTRNKRTRSGSPNQAANSFLEIARTFPFMMSAMDRAGRIVVSQMIVCLNRGVGYHAPMNSSRRCWKRSVASVRERILDQHKIPPRLIIP